MIRSSAAVMDPPPLEPNGSRLGHGARTLLSYPSVPLASSPFGAKNRWDCRRRAYMSFTPIASELAQPTQSWIGTQISRPPMPVLGLNSGP